MCLLSVSLHLTHSPAPPRSIQFSTLCTRPGTKIWGGKRPKMYTFHLHNRCLTLFWTIHAVVDFLCWFIAFTFFKTKARHLVHPCTGWKVYIPKSAIGARSPSVAVQREVDSQKASLTTLAVEYAWNLAGSTHIRTRKPVVLESTSVELSTWSELECLWYFIFQISSIQGKATADWVLLERGICDLIIGHEILILEQSPTTYPYSNKATQWKAMLVICQEG